MPPYLAAFFVNNYGSNDHRGGGRHDRGGLDDPDHGVVVCGYIRGCVLHSLKVPNLLLQQKQAFLN